MRGELSTGRGVDQRKMTDRLLLFNVSLLETNQKDIIETSPREIPRELKSCLLL